MPYDEVMHKFSQGQLHSGSKTGPKVGNRGQAIAIMLSEKRKAESGDEEYQPKHKAALHGIRSMSRGGKSQAKRDEMA